MPVHCRQEAWEVFSEAVEHLETTRGLVRAATALSMHELDAVDPEAIEERLDAIAACVRERLPRLIDAAADRPWTDHDVDIVLAHLHDVLFGEVRLRGNRDKFYDPANSYLPLVLDTGLGIPITLSLIYKDVAERVGLRVIGVNAPWHFLVGVEYTHAIGYVDPFCCGRLYNAEEALAQIEQIAGRIVPRDPSLLAPATHQQWIARMLQNLQVIFADRNDAAAFNAMVELRELL